ncbi:dual OB domain-containing protein [Burkholderia contaminans]|uniref:dual OB domain-containing protein n=1 Tax=Burkholderia contaminans TaxID=488447 RepID=UPI000F5824DA|nr:hypothetical protein [Burkholderia contaminans]
MTDIIITDLTRFANRDYLCIAGVTLDGKKCIRPLLNFDGVNPGYLKYEDCRKNNILPGTILTANFRSPQTRHLPHVEDWIVSGNITISRAATSDEFQSVLDATAYDSVDEGFGVLTNGEKRYPVDGPSPVRSIITLRVQPENFWVFEDGYGKLRAHFRDATGKKYSYLSVTDLGFFDYVGNPDTRRMQPDDAISVIRDEDELYLRIGLGREYQGSYWLQVNGIYTFPNYSLVLRHY